MNTFEAADQSINACECCDGGQVHVAMEKMAFPYGDPDKAVTLYADIPVWICDTCGESYTAEGAEEAERAAVCAHLGRLTPREIVALRKDAKLSQAAFARELGVGRITVSRWENGQQLQSSVYDRLIRSLMIGRPGQQGAHRESARFRTNVEHRRPAAPYFDLVAA